MNDSETLDDAAAFLPLKPADLQVLMVLCESPLHAYGIAKAVEEQLKGRVRLEVGSLYRIMSRLTAQGLVADGGGDQQGRSPAERRRDYRITPLGRRVAEAEARRLLDVIEVARGKHLLDGAGGHS